MKCILYNLSLYKLHNVSSNILRASLDILHIFREIKMYTKCLGRCSGSQQRLLTLLRHCSSNAKLTQSQMFKQQRLEKLRTIEKYPHYFASTTTAQMFCDKYQDLRDGDTCDDHVALTGMVTATRNSGKKLKFVDIESGGQTLQLKLARDTYSAPGEFQELAELLSRGDKLGRYRYREIK